MIQLTDASVEVNDEPIAVMPDSVNFTEGLYTPMILARAFQQ